MAENRDNILKKIETNLKYQFKNKQLLDRALTHRSFSNLHNERLEFLGDSVLSCILSDHLFEAHHGPEGELSIIRSNLINQNTLLEIGQKLDLFDQLQLGLGETKSSALSRPSLVANAVEALIGAIFLDSDFTTTYTIVLAWYEDYLSQPLSNINVKDFKSQLQEWCHKGKHPLPAYTLTQTTGQKHDQTFIVLCKVNGYQAEGEGGSRKKAEQVAAKKVMELLHEK